eukprot:318895_1
METLRNKIVAEHNQLIQQLEMKYLHYLSDLIKQKTLIHQEIQRNMYQQLFQISNISHLCQSKPNYQNTSDNIIHSQWKLPSPSLITRIPQVKTTNTFNINVSYDTYKQHITNCPKCSYQNTIPKNMCYHIQTQHPHLYQTFINNKIFSICSKCGESYHCMDTHECNWQQRFQNPVSHYNNTQEIKKKCDCDICTKTVKPHEIYMPNIQTKPSNTHTQNTLTQNKTIKIKLPTLNDTNMANISITPSVENKEHITINGNNNGVYLSNSAAAHGTAIDSRKSLEIDANYFETYFRNGDAQFEMKQYQKAYTAYSKSLSQMILTKQNETIQEEAKQKIKLCQIKMMEANKMYYPKYDPDIKLELRTVTADAEIDESLDFTFKCKNCSFETKWRQNLTRHLKIHSGERDFACSVCGRKFNQKSNLKVHSRIHTGERPYQCNICLKKFAASSNLKTHRKKKKTTNKYKTKIKK